MIRWGLCCQFKEEKIKFLTTTASSLLRMRRSDAFNKVSYLCDQNAMALESAIRYCARVGIGSFRIHSQILPCITHPEIGYRVEKLPRGRNIIRQLKACGRLAKTKNVRLTFHPDQFIVLSSLQDEVVQRSIADLEYQAMVSAWVGADVINIHAGGAYGDKAAALDRVQRNMRKLSTFVCQRLTFENDDKIYTPSDLIPFCLKTRTGFVYDVHHHRCWPDGSSVEETTRKALGTWDREPLFHLSSPVNGWRGKNIAYHHDYINAKDFPAYWLDLKVTVEIEAKAKELAILRLTQDLANLRTRKKQL